MKSLKVCYYSLSGFFHLVAIVIFRIFGSCFQPNLNIL